MANDLRILLLSRYGQLGASSRMRFYQFIPALEAAGARIDVSPLLDDDYLVRRYTGSAVKASRLIAVYVRRVARLLARFRYDLVWLEGEAFPWLPAWLETLTRGSGAPLVVDYDDALFHRYDRHRSALVRAAFGRKIDGIMRSARLVTVGSPYVAERARRAGARWIEQLPTAADAARYRIKGDAAAGVFTVGWIGSPLNARYLELVRQPLLRLAEIVPLRILLIGAPPGTLQGLPVEVRPWSSEREADDLLSADVGIMPLYDDSWERGKSGYKLIQYMAAGLPAVATPVGVNKTIIGAETTGFLAASDDDWVDALTKLARRPDLRRHMGAAGRAKFERLYSLQATAPKLVELMRKAAASSGSGAICPLDE